LHDAPNPEMSSVDFRRTLQAHALTWGGGFAEIERDGQGRVKYLWPITPDRVTIERDDRGLWYRVRNPGEPDTRLDPSRMVHIHGLGWDGVSGYSVVAKARESIGLGVAQDRFAGTFFGNGSAFGGVFEHPGRMSDPARKNFIESINSRHQGVERAHKLMVVEEGMKYVRTGIPPEDAQFLESRQFQVTEIARWFNVPPHKIGDLSRATFSNVEQQAQDYLQTCLLHWLKTWEQELMLKLISPLERGQQYIEHNVDGLLRGDSEGRASLQTAQFQIGGITPNEIRRLENRNPVDGGDRSFVQLNMVPLDRVDEYYDAQIESMKAKARPPQDPPKTTDEEAQRTRDALASLALQIEAATGAAALDALAETARLRESLTSAEVAKRMAEQRAEDLSGVLASVQESLTVAEATCVQLREVLAGAHQAFDQQRSDFDLERVGLTADLEAERARRAADAGVAQQAADAATEAAIRAAAERAAAEQERDAALAQAEASFAEMEARVTAAVNEAQLRTGAAAMKAEAAVVASAEAEAKALEAVAQRDAAVTALETATDQHAVRMADILAAHRAIALDVMSRLVEREADRARQHQATPTKLRAWRETFYPAFEDQCVEALLPAMRAHQALIGAVGDTEAATRDLVKLHIAESVRELSNVEQVDDFHVALDRTVRKWESERAARLADGLLVAGVAHVRRAQ
jgi:HK97 family phage portal protein